MLFPGLITTDHFKFLFISCPLLPLSAAYPVHRRAVCRMKPVVGPPWRFWRHFGLAYASKRTGYGLERVAFCPPSGYTLYRQGGTRRLPSDHRRCDRDPSVLLAE